MCFLNQDGERKWQILVKIKKMKRCCPNVIRLITIYYEGPLQACSENFKKGGEIYVSPNHLLSSPITLLRYFSNPVISRDIACVLCCVVCCVVCVVCCVVCVCVVCHCVFSQKSDTPFFVTVLCLTVCYRVVPFFFDTVSQKSDPVTRIPGHSYHVRIIYIYIYIFDYIWGVRFSEKEM